MTPRARGARTRTAIIDAALALFRDQGYEATTMRAVAERAGVSVGNAYYYFGSKEHLIQGFYDRAAEQHGAESAARLAGLTGRRAHRGPPAGVVRPLRAVSGLRRDVLPQRQRPGQPAEPVQP
jgi:AcrR family transcriptional regulator